MEGEEIEKNDEEMDLDFNPLVFFGLFPSCLLYVSVLREWDFP
jgi:hypothetical protein